MNTIILVHGWLDDASRMKQMAGFLGRRGYRVLAPSLKPSDGTVSLEELATQLGDFISANLSIGEHIDLVGYSMGGLVCRYYLQRLGGLSKVDRFVSIATPHNGTFTAYLFRRKGLGQMRPSSNFLKDLNVDADKLNMISCYSFYTPFDLSIIPAGSSRTSFSINQKFSCKVHHKMVAHRPLLKVIDHIFSSGKDLKDARK